MVIISFTLITLLCGAGVILFGEIICYSLAVIKELSGRKQCRILQNSFLRKIRTQVLSTLLTKRNINLCSRWFKQLCNHFGVDGDTYILYKPKGKSRTIGLSGEEALRQLKKGLHNPQMSFIYHCYNHYFCPIGYEDSPIKAADAYR